MAHGIGSKDSLVLARKPAWHGLGEVFPDRAPTWDEATAKLSWTVSKVPLVTATTLAKVPNVYAIVREDTQDVLGSVGSKYHCVQNLDAFGIVKHLVESGEAEVESAGSLFGGSRVWLQLRLKGQESIEVAPGDEVKPYLLVTTSHDGSAKLRVGFTAVRVVCNNTLTASLSRGGLTSIAHNSKAKDAMAILSATIDVGKRELASTAEVYRKLAERRLSAEVALSLIKSYRNRKKVAEQDENAAIVNELLLGVAIEESARELNIQSKIMDIFHLESGLSGGSAWHLYNAINAYHCHERGSAENRVNAQWFGDGSEDRELLQYVLDNTTMSAA